MHYEEGAEQQTNQQRWGQNQDHHARPQAVFGHGFPKWENCRTDSTLNEPALDRQTMVHFFIRHPAVSVSKNCAVKRRIIRSTDYA
ncbi:hypothetical protein D3C80_828660 [compost metagenome]